ncbi:Hypothetical protein RY67_1983 [Bifidobacterium longum subsp. infantis]|uniref:Uncharacterized protein n=1 Tax=Bifidobacterium longum subsp. infantis TaxID=1682 RepID=A0A0M4LI92_BIFLI|nr:Hypothetical protein RY67_1983 [Bifidobacterium longum subsp. infantis]
MPNPSYILGYSSLVRIATEPERPTKKENRREYRSYGLGLIPLMA